LVAAISVALRARRLNGTAPLGLGLVASGIACWVAGDAVSDVLASGSSGAVAYPSWADVMYLLGYALAIGGLARAACGALGRVPALPLIDGAIATATLFVLAWVGLALTTESVSSAGASLGLLAYPTLDVVALAVGVRLFGDAL
jgi:hypothetical protein